MVDATVYATIISDVGQTVSYYAVTKVTNNVTGDETLSYATATSKTWYFSKGRPYQFFNWAREGIVEQCDAWLIIPSTDTININDKVTVGGETYLVKKEHEVQYAGTTCYKVGVLMKI